MKGLIIWAKKILNKKNKKETYVRNDVMITAIKRGRGEQNGHRSNR